MDWLPLSNCFPGWDWILAQTPSPAPSPLPSPADVELLKSQLEFLKDSNGRLSDSFSQFMGVMQFTLVIFGFLGGVIAYIFGKNLDDARKVASQLIQQQVEERVATLVKAEVEDVKRTFQGERVISSTTVAYYLPEAKDKPKELKLIETRGFKSVPFCSGEQSLRRTPADVVVLDLENWIDASGQAFSNLSEAEREQQAIQEIDKLLQLLPATTVLVVYVRARVKYLYTISKERYVPPANNPVTLVGMVADGAYVAASGRSVN
jgi:hypothetical protein